MQKINIFKYLGIIVLACLANCAYAAGAPQITPSTAINPDMHGFVEVEGGKIYYETFNNKNLNATEVEKSIPMIVVHGGPGLLDHTYLLPQLSELANNNTVTFYDQRGSGKSLGFKLTVAEINIDDFMKDLEALRKKLGYKKFVLVGHSWGGLLAMRYATLYPEHVAKLILLNPAPASAVVNKAFEAEYYKRIAPIQAKLNKMKESEKYKNGDTNAIRDYYSKILSVYFYKPAMVKQLTLDMSAASEKMGTIINDIFTNTYLKTYDLTNDLKKLKIPTLIIHGDRDVVPVWTAMLTHGLIRDSKIIVIKECGHFPYIEQPKQFFTDVNQFLKSN